MYIVSLLRSSYHHTDLAIAKSDHSNISEVQEEEREEVEDVEDTDTWKLCAKLGPAWHLEVMGTVLNNVSILLMPLSRIQWSRSYLSSPRGEHE